MTVAVLDFIKKLLRVPTRVPGNQAGKPLDSGFPARLILSWRNTRYIRTCCLAILLRAWASFTTLFPANGRSTKSVKATTLTDRYRNIGGVGRSLLYQAQTRFEGWSAGRPPE